MCRLKINCILILLFLIQLHIHVAYKKKFFFLWWLHNVQTSWCMYENTEGNGNICWMFNCLQNYYSKTFIARSNGISVIEATGSILNSLMCINDNVSFPFKHSPYFVIHHSWWNIYCNVYQIKYHRVLSSTSFTTLCTIRLLSIPSQDWECKEKVLNCFRHRGGKTAQLKTTQKSGFSELLQKGEEQLIEYVWSTGDYCEGHKWVSFAAIFSFKFKHSLHVLIIPVPL